MNNTVKIIIIVVVCLAIYHYVAKSNEVVNQEHFAGAITPSFLAFIAWLQANDRHASLQALLSNMTINNDMIQFNKKITVTDDLTIRGADKQIEFVHPTGNKVCGIRNGGNGRLHVYGDELLYLLNKSGVIISADYGGRETGAGNLLVAGPLTAQTAAITGNFNTQGATILNGALTVQGASSLGGSLNVQGVSTLRGGVTGA